METGSISPFGGNEPIRRYTANKQPIAKKDQGESKAAGEERKDSVELSATAKSQNRILQARERLKKGFYDSESVRDAVSDKLSGIFEEEES